MVQIPTDLFDSKETTEVPAPCYPLNIKEIRKDFPPPLGYISNVEVLQFRVDLPSFQGDFRRLAGGKSRKTNAEMQAKTP